MQNLSSLSLTDRLARFGISHVADRVEGQRILSQGGKKIGSYGYGDALEVVKKLEAGFTLEAAK